MRKNQIAAQLYTLRDFALTAEDLDETLRKVKAIGYEAVQVSGIGPIDPDAVKALADKHGLVICATHISEDRFVNDLPNVIEQHQHWGCKYVGLGGMPVRYRTSKSGYQTMGTEFSAIGQKLQATGLQFVYHNHKFEYEKFEGVTGMDWLLESSDAHAFHFLLDTYWVQAGGADPVKWIYKVKDRMKVIHLKDYAIVKDEAVFAEIGEGNLDWDAIIAACREIGVEWYVVEQDTCLRNPFESLAISYNYLAKLAYG